ncbi:MULTISPECIES: lytic transglycosylase domain-containing protein [Pelosinus]|uniref:Lytic transglycosylase catalytic n=1 Tax=Pelosinus fermentans B4 TaxID=1149862 RepID=I9AZ84_9FIRM|nr:MULTISPECIES: lytic transglycosylase domain-containing protein [Pelosinus]EIW18212.1 Lytic transglycosylase catalytic [Pelosinus fermentans B4]EIW24016.1 Lytic transglycosylase catalytic [Pelosinus fermentans A11]OAM94056.1 Lytic transglycosylase catalytic [Pelosinus fermentans DSM 17108]SDQ98511.1 Transglycosylase SLT domain-containing protein [Pelosinus fermentans]
MESISKVLQRINTIEQRFNHSSVSGHDFSAVLSGAQANDSIHGKNFASDDISKIIDYTAKKYGVDSKLVMAVAKVESNLSPDVVSSAGAVGVMQLMPETAQGLGVRNCKDPRDNIDGGVRYLKQLITSFDGDITKAVAAYNAGPQAVTKYNGIPPYTETKDYVAKVMALVK